MTLTAIRVPEWVHAFFGVTASAGLCRVVSSAETSV